VPQSLENAEIESGIPLASRNADRLTHDAAGGPNSGAGAMEDEKLTEISMKGAPPCGRCHMLVARYAPQVVATTGTYHRECYEAWYFGRYGRRPSLLAGINGDRHRYQVREAKAA
jgi:hypothetical protein